MHISGLAMLLIISSTTLLLLLEILLEKKTRALEQMRKDLEEQLAETTRSSQSRDAFFAHISHELKTPLNTILGMSYLLKRTRLTPRQKDLAFNIEKSGDLLLSIIQNVLDLSRMKSGTLPIHEEPFPLRVLPEALDQTFREQAAVKGITWRCRCDFKDETIVSLDKYRTSQILINLIGNAMKFTERGFVSLEMSIKYKTEDGSCWLEIRVKDSGIGISPENLSRIFEEFEQVENHMVKYHQGTGLGLPITKQLVTAMGGTITVESGLGKGSLFTVHLPLKNISYGTLNTPKPVRVRKGKWKDAAPVLVVEDTSINADIVQQLLAEIGVRSEIASDGPEAIQLCRYRKPDYFSLVLMDIHMPKMDGFTASRILKTEVGICCPIIALTATSLTDAVVESNQSIISDYILKPFNAVAFQQRVSELLESAKSNADVETDLSAEASFRIEESSSTSDTAPSPASSFHHSPDMQLLSLSKKHQGGSSPKKRSVNSTKRETSPLCFSNKDMALAYLGGREDLYCKYMERFCRNYNRTDFEIRHFISEQNLSEAHRIAHSVKGLAGMLGMVPLFECAKNLCDSLKEGSSEELPSLLDAYAETLDLTLSEITPTFISSTNSSDPQSG